MKTDSKSAFILLPDGVGLRNFAFTQFPEIAEDKNLHLTYWNNTEFPLQKELGLNELVITKAKNHAVSDLYKRAKTKIELRKFYRESKDKAFLSYRFPDSYSSVKKLIKNTIVNLIAFTHRSEKGQNRVRKQIAKYESSTTYFADCVQQLSEHKPDIVFCTNQRPILAVAPLLAAKSLNIPTGTFIFSWDNLPKGTMIVETDYYFVWSDYMRKELLRYYPYIEDRQIIIVGTPQFEVHFNEDHFESKEVFFEKHNLDVKKKYICFSGDDITTSPYDQNYLEDLVLAVRSLNTEGKNLGIIFRKCPVDFTGRFDEVLQKNADIITAIDPIWKNLGNSWNKVMPFKEDISLLINTIRYSELIINIGSTMAFDGYAHNTPCVYINYDHAKADKSSWSITPIYKFIHFKSMPSKRVVFWANAKEDLEAFILKSLDKESVDLSDMSAWFNTISMAPQSKASERIVESVKNIIS